jgi:hypothetical protein
MGTTEETYPGSNVFYYAFGGQPKTDWSGLDPSSERLLADTYSDHWIPYLDRRVACIAQKGWRLTTDTKRV